MSPEKTIRDLFLKPYKKNMEANSIPTYHKREFNLIKDEGQKIFILLRGEKRPIWVLKSSIEWVFKSHL